MKNLNTVMTNAHDTYIHKPKTFCERNMYYNSDYRDAGITETEICGIHEETSKLFGAQNEED